MKRLLRLGRLQGRRMLAALALSATILVHSAAAQEPPIGEDAALYLVRSTLVALSQANETGNYTVLRDLGAPGFREANDAARLAAIFASLRASGLDLSYAALAAPSFAGEPRLTGENMLYLSGTMPTGAASVAFELLFQAVEGNWRLFGISVNPVASPAQGAEAGAPQAPNAEAPASPAEPDAPEEGEPESR